MATIAELEQRAAAIRAAQGEGGEDAAAFLSRQVRKKATPEQVNAAWFPHMGRLIAGTTDPWSGSPGPPDVEGILGRQAEEQAQLAGLAPDPAVRKDLERKLLARDITTVGGMFFGGPAATGGVGVLGAVAGAAGRLAGGASIGAWLGLAEGALGGYDAEELPRIAGEYALGAVALGGLAEAGLGAIGAVKHLQARSDLKRLISLVDNKPRSTAEMQAAIAQHPEVANLFAEITKADKARAGARVELKTISREVSGRTRNVAVGDIEKNAGLRDFLFNQLREKYPDLSPNADPAVLWQHAKKEGILPRAPKALGKKYQPVQSPSAESARSAYAATLGQPDVAGSFYSRGRRLAATKAARTAAYHTKNKELAELLNAGKLRTAAYDGSLDLNISKSHKWAYNMLVKRVADLIESPQFFGDVGRPFGQMLHEYVVLKEATEGHWMRLIQDHVLEGLKGTDFADLDKYLRWNGPATNARVLQAARRWLSVRRFVARETKALGLPAKDRGLTEVFRSMKPGAKGELLKLQHAAEKAAASQAGEDFMALAELEDAITAPEVKSLWADLKRLEGKLVEKRGWHVERPFMESDIKAPDYIKPEVLDALRNNPDHPIVQGMVAQILRERPELKHPSTGEAYHNAVMNEVYDRLGIGGTSAPDYIWNNSLQWSREAMIDPKYRISDPRTWMMRYVHGAATRHSAARVFGAREEKWVQLLDRLKEQTATHLAGREFAPAGYGSFEGQQFKTAPNIQLMQDIYDMAMGRGRVAPDWLRQASDLTLRQRLGYTTFLKQFSSLKNVAAAHGIANTLDAMYMVLRDPKARVASDDFGATVADLVRVLADETKAINPTNPTLRAGVKLLWGESAADQIRRTGTLVGDRFTRRVSAVAAGLKVSAAARTVRNLGSKSLRARMEAEQARRWLEAMDLDVDQILASGLTDGQRRQAMLAGARSTQFTSTVEDVPAFLSTDPLYGRMVGLLNKFSLQQGPFMLRHVVGEAIKGNMKPAIGFAVFMGLTDRGVAELLKALSNQNYDVATDLMVDSIFGKFGSVAADANEDRVRTVGNVALGPIASLGADALGVAVEAAKAGGSVLAGEPGDALTHAGKAVWHASPATLRQFLYMMQAGMGTKE